MYSNLKIYFETIDLDKDDDVITLKIQTESTNSRKLVTHISMKLSDKVNRKSIKLMSTWKYLRKLKNYFLLFDKEMIYDFRWQC